MENGNGRKLIPGSPLSDEELIDITPTANNIRLRAMSGLEDGGGTTRRSPSHNNGYSRGDFDHDGE